MGAEGYLGLPAYYVESSDPLTPNLGLSLKGMDPIVAENFVIIDSNGGGSGGGVKPYKTLYVDGTRTDSYTANGALGTPFKTIMGAVNQVISNADNATYQYIIKIQPATYAENVILENVNLYDIVLDGQTTNNADSEYMLVTSPLGTNISPVTGNALQSTTSNTQLAELSVRGITFIQPVVLTAGVTSAGFMSTALAFDNCYFGITPNWFSNLTITGPSAATSPINVTFDNTSIGSNLTVTNVNMVFNNSFYDGTTLTFNNTGTPANSFITLRNSYIDCFSSGTIGNNCIMYVYQGSSGGNLTVASGGNLISYGGYFFPTITIQAGGKFENNGPTSTQSISGIFSVSPSASWQEDSWLYVGGITSGNEASISVLGAGLYGVGNGSIGDFTGGLKMKSLTLTDTAATNIDFILQNTTASVSGTGAAVVVSGVAHRAVSSGQITLNTAGATTLLLAYLMDDQSGTPPTISDSLNNAWNYTPTIQNGNFYTRVAYAYAASGGGALVLGSDTFTVVGTFAFACIYAISGTLTTSAVFEASNGVTQVGTASAATQVFQTGPITPAAGNVVITGFGWNATISSPTVVAGGGNDTFTNLLTQTSNADETGAAAIILSASGAPVNALWNTGIVSAPAITTIASFKVAAPKATNQSSPLAEFAGTVWNGSSSTVDKWTVQVVDGNAVNPASYLSFVQAGSTGPAAVSVPALKIGSNTGLSVTTAGTVLVGSGAVGDYSGSLQAWNLYANIWGGLLPVSGVNSPALPSIGFAGGSATGLIYDSPWLEIVVAGSLTAAFTGSSGVQINTGGALAWVTSGIRGTFDTSISRSSAGVVQVGSGTSTNALGTLLAKGVTVSDTAANADLVLQNPTTATVSTTNASPLAEFEANYWTGSASAADTWTIGSSLAAGSNGLSTLTITHSGSAPSGNVAPVINLAGGSFGTTINSNIALNFQVGSTFQGYFQNGSLSLSSLAGFCFLPNNIPTSSPDTGLTRVSAGVVAVGNGTNLNTSGNLQLNQITKYNGEATVAPGIPYTRGVTSQKAETGADASLLSVTPAAAIGTYRIKIVMSVSAANTATLGWTATWTDANGTAQTPTNLSLFTSGTAAPALTVTAAANGVYYGEAFVDINNAGTAIVVKTTFSGTSIAYKATATIERIV